MDARIDPGVLEDANSGRAWISPTALTPPAGTWSFSDHMLFLIGGSYSPVNTLSLSAMTLIPLTSDQPFTALLSAKLQVLRSARLRVAAHGVVWYLEDRDSAQGFSIGAVGGAATYCIDADCHSFLNAYAGAGFSSEKDNQSLPLALAGSLALRLSRHVKLLLEADTAAVLGEINDVASGFLGWYGLRFTSAQIAADVGLVRPFCKDCDSDVFPIGFPWINFSYRAL